MQPIRSNEQRERERSDRSNEQRERERLDRSKEPRERERSDRSNEPREHERSDRSNEPRERDRSDRLNEPQERERLDRSNEQRERERSDRSNEPRECERSDSSSSRRRESRESEHSRERPVRTDQPRAARHIEEKRRRERERQPATRESETGRDHRREDQRPHKSEPGTSAQTDSEGSKRTSLVPYDDDDEEENGQQHPAVAPRQRLSSPSGRHRPTERAADPWNGNNREGGAAGGGGRRQRDSTADRSRERSAARRDESSRPSPAPRKATDQYSRRPQHVSPRSSFRSRQSQRDEGRNGALDLQRFRSSSRRPDADPFVKPSPGRSSVRTEEPVKIKVEKKEPEEEGGVKDYSKMTPEEVIAQEKLIWIRSAPADLYYERDPANPTVMRASAKSKGFQVIKNCFCFFTTVQMIFNGKITLFRKRLKKNWFYRQGESERSFPYKILPGTVPVVYRILHFDKNAQGK